MPQTADGTLDISLWVVGWTKSSYSTPQGSCLEVAELAGGKVAVRNSRHPGGPALVHPRAEVTLFVQAVQEGEFDAITG